MILLKMFVKWIRRIKMVGPVPGQVACPRGAESRCGYYALWSTDMSACRGVQWMHT